MHQIVSTGVYMGRVNQACMETVHCVQTTLCTGHFCTQVRQNVWTNIVSLLLHFTTNTLPLNGLICLGLKEHNLKMVIFQIINKIWFYLHHFILGCSTAKCPCMQKAACVLQPTACNPLLWRPRYVFIEGLT